MILQKNKRLKMILEFLSFKNLKMEHLQTTSEKLKETLEKYGVAIIPNVLTEEECDILNIKTWDFFEELTSTFKTESSDLSGSFASIKRDKPETWKSIYALYPMHSMLFQHWKIGHAQYVWDIRQNLNVITPFCKLWNKDPEELLVSFDGASFGIPPEVTNRGWFRGNKNLEGNSKGSWYHVDQSFTRNDFECVQSWVTMYDVNEGDATLAFLEGSHILHKEFRKSKLKDVSKTSGSGMQGIPKDDWYKFNEEEIQFYLSQGCQEKRIVCPKGSQVFWDSRTVHCGAEPIKDRKCPTFRNVVYVCYTPRELCSEANLKKRIKAFEELRMTTHYPHKPKLFPEIPRTYGGPLPKVKDIDPPVLSDLGRKLVGY